MPVYQPKHNANLLNTLPQTSANVNRSNCSVSIVLDEAKYEVDYAPSNLFVKVTNRIYDFKLKPRLLEFYCLMSYICFSFPKTELPILTIGELIYQFTHIHINKNTINTYLKDLIALGLIRRVGKFYHITDIENKLVNEGIPLASMVDCPEQDGSWSNGLYSKDSSDVVPSLVTSNSCNSRPFGPPSY
jgi:hypothetical protein